MIELNNTEQEIWYSLLLSGFPTFIVGGAVRDHLLGKESKDIDFATKATPAQIERLFSKSKFKLDFVGASFGVMLVGGVEVATFRGDRYFGGGDKDVEITYVDTIQEDLARRDLTINALAMDINGVVIDPFCGASDLRKRVIRFVGNAEDRINEDPNRILRAVRFATRFDFFFDNDTAGAIIDNNHKVLEIAPERIRLEILKTMGSARKSSLFWTILLDTGILRRIFPEMTQGVNHDHGNHHEEDIWTHNMIAGDTVSTRFPLLKLATYLHDVGKPASFDEKLGTFYEHQHFGADIVRKRLADLKFSNDEIRFVVNAVLIHMDGTRGMSSKSRRRLKNKLNAYGLDWRDYVRLRMGDRTGNVLRPNFTISQVKDYVELFNVSEEVPMSVNDLVLSGGDIIRIFNLTPGPLVGKVQRELLAQVIDNGDEFNTVKNLINHVEVIFELEADLDEL